jgi:hypothetical protein
MKVSVMFTDIRNVFVRVLCTRGLSEYLGFIAIFVHLMSRSIKVEIHEVS